MKHDVLGFHNNEPD